jgi:hypothetical protein
MSALALRHGNAFTLRIYAHENSQPIRLGSVSGSLWLSTNSISPIDNPCFFAALFFALLPVAIVPTEARHAAPI